MGEFVEQSGGDGVAALRVGKGEQNGVVGGMALLGAVQSVQPGVEFLAAFGQAELGSSAMSSQQTHESVNGAQGFALAAGQGEEGVVKIFGAPCG